MSQTQLIFLIALQRKHNDHHFGVEEIDLKKLQELGPGNKATKRKKQD